MYRILDLCDPVFGKSCCKVSSTFAQVLYYKYNFGIFLFILFTSVFPVSISCTSTPLTSQRQIFNFDFSYYCSYFLDFDYYYQTTSTK